MARSLQTASLSFGLVNIPIRLYTAATSKSVSFHMLHQKDGSRVRQHLFCETEDKEITRDDIVKGFEISKGRYIQLSDEELEVLEAQANRSVEIQEFVNLDDVDPVYFEKTYYLGPDKGGEKPYALLAQALRDRNQAAVAQFVMRGKENLVLVRPYADAYLAMDVMYYADEVRDVKEVEVQAVKIREGELKLALQLIENLSSKKWQPEKYRDSYRERVMDVIKKKQKGEEVSVPKRREPAEVVDLMEALKRSLGKRQGTKKTSERVERQRTTHRQLRNRKAS
jgi:DNA end-binding protein Ku